MALTDPELDLLREMLEEDPTDPVFLQVGEELVRRNLHAEARAVLQAGLRAHPEAVDGWRHLTRAALECSDYDEALRAWDRAGDRHQADPSFASLRILALERAGRTAEAREAIEAFEARFGDHDVVVEAAKERLSAPEAARSLSARDPFLTVALAERYVAMGREDRAIRVYRRILFRHPDQVSLQARIVQLDRAFAPPDDFTDLSEELADPNSVPPVFEMPRPAITSASVKPAPTRHARPPMPARPPDTVPPLPALDAIDAPDPEADPLTAEEPTEIDAPIPAPGSPRRKVPAALEAFMRDVREAERRAATPEDAPTEEMEELPGLSELMPTPKRRKKRRSLLKR